MVARHYVGAVGAVFNDAGQVLLVKHVFRVEYPWGLPGGWLEKGEDPAAAVQREIREELGLEVEVGQVLLCERQGGQSDTSTPVGIGLAFYCRAHPQSSTGAKPIDPGNADAFADATAFEVLAVEWVAPDEIIHPLVSFQRRAIEVGKTVFEQEQALVKS
ncbi:MAG: NUDIX hydrolase [Anaerolineae bacterium]|nr:NUDIX hydrolase [Anaerolineae bacterium]